MPGCTLDNPATFGIAQAVRDEAILALLSERTIAIAAKKVGIDESTLGKWLTTDEAFKAEYAAARQAAFQAGMSGVQRLTAKAIDALEELLDDTDHPNVRLGAAAEFAIHQHDAETILEKVDQVEAYQRQQAGRRE